MQLTLHTDRESYLPGQPVQLRLELFNDRAEPVRLTFNSSRKFDFEVLWEDQLLWRWSADRLFAQMLTEETLAPGERRTFEATWDGQIMGGEVAKPGEYLARGILTVSGRLEPMADQSFAVTGSAPRAGSGPSGPDWPPSSRR
jgi:Intracellular proteinase inhibitor